MVSSQVQVNHCRGEVRALVSILIRPIFIQLDSDIFLNGAAVAHGQFFPVGSAWLPFLSFGERACQKLPGGLIPFIVPMGIVPVARPVSVLKQGHADALDIDLGCVGLRVISQRRPGAAHCAEAQAADSQAEQDCCAQCGRQAFVFPLIHCLSSHS